MDIPELDYEKKEVDLCWQVQGRQLSTYTEDSYVAQCDNQVRYTVDNPFLSHCYRTFISLQEKNDLKTTIYVCISACCLPNVLDKKQSHV